MSGRHPLNDHDQIPGPGAYDPNTKLRMKQMPFTKMGRAKRTGLEFNLETPGPGAYNSTKDKFLGKQAPRPM